MGAGKASEKKQEREQTTIRLPVELVEALKQEAEQRGMSFNTFVLMLLNEARNHLN